MSSKITDISTSDLIFKKFLGNAGAYPGASYALEVGNARPNVFSSLQIFSQSIPLVAPTDFVITSYLWGSLSNGSYTSITSTTTNTSPANDLINIGQIFTSTSYPYIQKIVGLHLSPITLGTSYRFADPTKSIINYLNQTIPNNTDVKTGTYSYTLNSSNGFIYGSSTNISFPSNSTPNWFIDTDVGYLYFPNNDWNQSHNPVISFYRYNGSIGLNSSTPIETQDPWLLTNLIGAPPAPTNIKIDRLTDDVFVMFTYPPQYNFGLINTLVPNITGAVLSIINNGSDGPNIITTPTNYFKTKTNSQNPIQCLHFYKGANNNYNNQGYTSYTKDQIDHFKIDAVPPPGSPPIAKFYYTNFNSLTNPINFTISYLIAGFPGSETSPHNITIKFISFSGGNSGVASPTITITISSDEYYADVINTYTVTASTPLTDTITYTPVSNSVRHEGVKNTTPQTDVVITKSASPLFPLSTNVYPDTVYKIKLSSSNSTNTTPSNEITTAPTPGIDITALRDINNNSLGLSYITSSSTNNSFTLTLPTNVPAKRVDGVDGTFIVITDNTTDITGNATFRVHNSFENRGVNTNAKILNISSSIFNGSNLLSNGTSTSFNLNNEWAGDTNDWTNTNTNISVTKGNFTSLGSGALSGYYATCPITATIKTSNYITSASTNIYRVTISGNYTSINVPNGSINTPYTYKYNSQLFCYDGPVPTPTCTISLLTINTAPIQISGITLYNDAISVTPNIIVGNIGTNFYNATKTVEYSGSIGGTATVKKDDGESKETDLPNGYKISTSTPKSGTFTNPLTFEKISGRYSTSLSLTATAYAISGNGVAESKTLDIIYDTKSVFRTTIDDAYINPTTESLITPNGCRVYSTENAGTVENISSTNNLQTNNNFTNNGKSYSFRSETSPLYNNTTSLTSPSYAKELLYASGMYVTPAYSSNFYINYSSSGNPDYSGILPSSPIYRYVTFAWKVPESIFQNTTVYDTLTFNMLGVSGITITNNLAYTNSTDLLNIFYRVEDVNALSIATTPTKTITTYWINANSNVGSQIGSSNCFIGQSPTTNYLALTEANTKLNGTTCIFPAKTGGYTFSSASSSATSNNNNPSPVYIYCRVGVSLRSDFSFTGMNCIISSSS